MIAYDRAVCKVYFCTFVQYCTKTYKCTCPVLQKDFANSQPYAIIVRRMMNLKERKINRLLRRLKRSDDAALSELFAEVSGILLRIANGYLSNRGAAEDIVAETFRRVIQRAADFDDDKSGLNWLITITKNLSLSYLRDNKKLKPLEEANEEADLNAFYLTIETREDVLAAVDRLSEDEKQLVYLKFWEGYSNTELAERLGVSNSTITRRLEKIYEKLKKFL